MKTRAAVKASSAILQFNRVIGLLRLAYNSKLNLTEDADQRLSFGYSIKWSETT